MFVANRQLGVTIDSSGIRYVLVRQKKGWEVEKIGFFPFAENAVDEEQIKLSVELQNQLKSWVKSEGIYGKPVTLSMPTSHIIIRKLQIGVVNARELDQIIDLEVETALHLPFSNPVYDYIAAASTEHSTDVLVYASRQSWIHQCNELLHDAGLKVKHAELSSTALARAIKFQHNEPLEDTMLLHLDKETTEVYLFHNGNPVFMRVINEYGHQEIVERGLTPELIGSINAEISRLLNFYQYSIHNGQAQITRMIVSGSRGGREQFVSAIKQDQPDIRVDVFDIELSGLDSGDYIVPFGLAIRGKKNQGINLLPEMPASKIMLPVKLIIVATVWLLCLGTILALYMSNRSLIKSHKEEAEALSGKAALLEQQINELNSSSKNQSDPEAVIQYLQENKQEVVAVWDELAFELPSDADFVELDYSMPGKLLLMIRCNELQDISDYLVSLRGMSFTGAAKLQSFAKNKDNKWSVRYEIQWPQKSVKLPDADVEGSDTNE
ncbi:Competence protein A [compost metagenome]